MSTQEQRSIVVVGADSPFREKLIKSLEELASANSRLAEAAAAQMHQQQHADPMGPGGRDSNTSFRAQMLNDANSGDKNKNKSGGGNPLFAAGPAVRFFPFGLPELAREWNIYAVNGDEDGESILPFFADQADAFVITCALDDAASLSSMLQWRQLIAASTTQQSRDARVPIILALLKPAAAPLRTSPEESLEFLENRDFSHCIVINPENGIHSDIFLRAVRDAVTGTGTSAGGAGRCVWVDAEEALTSTGSGTLGRAAQSAANLKQQQAHGGSSAGVSNASMAVSSAGAAAAANDRPSVLNTKHQGPLVRGLMCPRWRVGAHCPHGSAQKCPFVHGTTATRHAKPYVLYEEERNVVPYVPFISEKPKWEARGFYVLKERGDDKDLKEDDAPVWLCDGNFERVADSLDAFVEPDVGLIWDGDWVPYIDNETPNPDDIDKEKSPMTDKDGWMFATDNWNVAQTLSRYRWNGKQYLAAPGVPGDWGRKTGHYVRRRAWRRVAIQISQPITAHVLPQTPPHLLAREIALIATAAATVESRAPRSAHESVFAQAPSAVAALSVMPGGLNPEARTLRFADTLFALVDTEETDKTLIVGFKAPNIEIGSGMFSPGDMENVLVNLCDASRLASAIKHLAETLGFSSIILTGAGVGGTLAAMFGWWFLEQEMSTDQDDKKDNKNNNNNENNNEDDDDDDDNTKKKNIGAAEHYVSAAIKDFYVVTYNSPILLSTPSTLAAQRFEDRFIHILDPRASCAISSSSLAFNLLWRPLIATDDASGGGSSPTMAKATAEGKEAEARQTAQSRVKNVLVGTRNGLQIDPNSSSGGGVGGNKTVSAIARDSAEAIWPLRAQLERDLPSPGKYLFSINDASGKMQLVQPVSLKARFLPMLSVAPLPKEMAPDPVASNSALRIATSGALKCVRPQLTGMPQAIGLVSPRASSVSILFREFEQTARIILQGSALALIKSVEIQRAGASAATGSKSGLTPSGGVVGLAEGAAGEGGDIMDRDPSMFGGAVPLVDDSEAWWRDMAKEEMPELFEENEKSAAEEKKRNDNALAAATVSGLTSGGSGLGGGAETSVICGVHHDLELGAEGDELIVTVKTIGGSNVVPRHLDITVTSVFDYVEPEEAKKHGINSSASSSASLSGGGGGGGSRFTVHNLVPHVSTDYLVESSSEPRELLSKAFQLVLYAQNRSTFVIIEKQLDTLLRNIPIEELLLVVATEEVRAMYDADAAAAKGGAAAAAAVDELAATAKEEFSYVLNRLNAVEFRWNLLRKSLRGLKVLSKFADLLGISKGKGGAGSKYAAAMQQQYPNIAKAVAATLQSGQNDDRTNSTHLEEQRDIDESHLVKVGGDKVEPFLTMEIVLGPLQVRIRESELISQGLVRCPGGDSKFNSVHLPKLDRDIFLTIRSLVVLLLSYYSSGSVEMAKTMFGALFSSSVGGVFQYMGARVRNALGGWISNIGRSRDDEGGVSLSAAVGDVKEYLATSSIYEKAFFYREEQTSYSESLDLLYRLVKKADPPVNLNLAQRESVVFQRFNKSGYKTGSGLTKTAFSNWLNDALVNVSSRCHVAMLARVRGVLIFFTLRALVQIRPICLAVGATGSGKSTLISAACGHPKGFRAGLSSAARTIYPVFFMSDDEPPNMTPEMKAEWLQMREEKKRREQEADMSGELSPTGSDDFGRQESSMSMMSATFGGAGDSPTSKASGRSSAGGRKPMIVFLDSVGTADSAFESSSSTGDTRASVSNAVRKLVTDTASVRVELGPYQRESGAQESNFPTFAKTRDLRDCMGTAGRKMPPTMFLARYPFGPDMTCELTAEQKKNCKDWCEFEERAHMRNGAPVVMPVRPIAECPNFPRVFGDTRKTAEDFCKVVPGAKPLVEKGLIVGVDQIKDWIEHQASLMSTERGSKRGGRTKQIAAGGRKAGGAAGGGGFDPANAQAADGNEQYYED